MAHTLLREELYSLRISLHEKQKKIIKKLTDAQAELQSVNYFMTLVDKQIAESNNVKTTA